MKYKVGDIIFIKDEVRRAYISPFKVIKVRKYEKYDVMELRSKFVYDKLSLDNCRKATKQELGEILLNEI